MISKISPFIVSENKLNLNKLFFMKDYDNKKINFFSNIIDLDINKEKNIFEVVTSLKEKFFDLKETNFDDFENSIFCKKETEKIIKKLFSNFIINDMIIYQNTLCFFTFLYHALNTTINDRKKEISYLKDIEIYVCEIKNQKIEKVSSFYLFSLLTDLCNCIKSDKNLFNYNKKSFIHSFILYNLPIYNEKNIYFSIDCSDNIFDKDYEKELKFTLLTENLEKNTIKISEKRKIIMLKEYCSVLFFYFCTESKEMSDDVKLYIKILDEKTNLLDFELFHKFDKIMKLYYNIPNEIKRSIK